MQHYWIKIFFLNWLVIHTKWFEKYDHHLCINNIFSLKVWFVEGVIICFILFVWGFGDCRWRAANFDLCSASWLLKFFSVSQLLWHGASVYNGHIRGHVTLTPIAERLAVELSLPVFTTGLSRLGFEHLTFRLRVKRSKPLPNRRGYNHVSYILLEREFYILYIHVIKIIHQ